MQESGRQQAYDRGSTIFSPDGRLYQVEYAREAAGRGSPVVGVRTAEGVALAAVRRVRSPLVEPGSVSKLHRVDDHLAMASAGHAADARRLVEHGRETAQRDRLQFDEPMATAPFTDAVADHVQEYTQVGGTRPYGATTLVAGVDDSGPRLFEIDPSGTPVEYRAAAIGDGSAAIREHLEAEYAPEIALGDGLAVAVEALAAVEKEALDADGVALGTVTDDDGFRRFDREERAGVVGAS
jgi:proteasome alpha subunit